MYFSILIPPQVLHFCFVTFGVYIDIEKNYSSFFI